jgi:hypothetical protein
MMALAPALLMAMVACPAGSAPVGPLSGLGQGGDCDNDGDPTDLGEHYECYGSGGQPGTIGQSGNGGQPGAGSQPGAGGGFSVMGTDGGTTDGGATDGGTADGGMGNP